MSFRVGAAFLQPSSVGTTYATILLACHSVRIGAAISHAKLQTLAPL